MNYVEVKCVICTYSEWVDNDSGSPNRKMKLLGFSDEFGIPEEDGKLRAVYACYNCYVQWVKNTLFAPTLVEGPKSKKVDICWECYKGQCFRHRGGA